MLTDVQLFNKAIQYKKVNNTGDIYEFLENNISKIKIDNYNIRFISNKLAKIFNENVNDIILWLSLH